MHDMRLLLEAVTILIEGSKFLQDDASEIYLFHGTHKDHVPSFQKYGAKANWDRTDLNRGAVFLTPRADVAFAYAVMNGEAQYLMKGGRPKDVPDQDRALIVFKVPREWYEAHVVREVEGSAPEVSFNDTVPAEFIVDVVIGDRQKVYRYLTINEGFKTDSTGIPNPDEILFGNEYQREYWRDKKGVQGKVIYMHPETYIEKCKEGFASIGEIGNIRAGRYEEKIDKYAEMMRQGVKFHMPMLDIFAYESCLGYQFYTR
jgi:hypothetical protein